MTESADRHRKTASRVRLAGLCLAIALAAPLLAFVGAAGMRTGLWDWRVGFDLLTLRAAWIATWAGALAALFALWAAFGARRAWLMALAALAASVATLAVFIPYFARTSGSDTAPDVSTNPEDPPAYSRQIVDQRQASGAAPLDRWGSGRETCPGVVSVPSQAAPGAAAYALQAAGFEVLGFGVGRADGTRISFWYGFTHDAIVRIRPGRTDVRVTAREDRDDGGEACRLAARIVAALSGETGGT